MHSRDIINATKKLMETYGLGVCDIPDEVFRQAVAQSVKHGTALNYLAEQALRETFIAESVIGDETEDELLKGYKKLKKKTIAANTYPFQGQGLKVLYDCNIYTIFDCSGNGLVTTENGHFIGVPVMAPQLPEGLSEELQGVQVNQTLQLEAVPTTLPLRAPNWSAERIWQRRLWVYPVKPAKVYEGDEVKEGELIAHYKGEQRFELYAAPSNFGNCRVMARDPHNPDAYRFTDWLLFEVRGGSQSWFEKPMHLFYDARIPASELEVRVRAFMATKEFNWYR